MKITPLGDRVIIKPLDQAETKKGGIIIPDTAKEKPQEGEVIAVGKGRLTNDGKHVTPEVSAGDRVLFGKYAATEIMIDDEPLLVLKESDILAKV